MEHQITHLRHHRFHFKRPSSRRTCVREFPIFFLQLVWNSPQQINGTGLLQARCTSHHPTNSVKCTEHWLQSGKTTWAGLTLFWSTSGLLRKGVGLYTVSQTLTSVPLHITHIQLEVTYNIINSNMSLTDDSKQDLILQKQYHAIIPATWHIRAVPSI